MTNYGGTHPTNYSSVSSKGFPNGIPIQKSLGLPVSCPQLDLVKICGFKSVFGQADKELPSRFR